jgi:hypothetical protein
VGGRYARQIVEGFDDIRAGRRHLGTALDYGRLSEPRAGYGADISLASTVRVAVPTAPRSPVPAYSRSSTTKRFWCSGLVILNCLIASSRAVRGSCAGTIPRKVEPCPHLRKMRHMRIDRDLRVCVAELSTSVGELSTLRHSVSEQGAKAPYSTGPRPCGAPRSSGGLGWHVHDRKPTQNLGPGAKCR